MTIKIEITCDYCNRAIQQKSEYAILQIPGLKEHHFCDHNCFNGWAKENYLNTDLSKYTYPKDKQA